MAKEELTLELLMAEAKKISPNRIWFIVKFDSGNWVSAALRLADEWDISGNFHGTFDDDFELGGTRRQVLRDFKAFAKEEGGITGVSFAKAR